MNVRSISYTVRVSLGAFVLTACSLGQLDRELIGDDAENGGNPSTAGASPRATGGNGLTRPPNSGGQSATAGGMPNAQPTESGPVPDAPITGSAGGATDVPSAPGSAGAGGASGGGSFDTTAGAGTGSGGEGSRRGTGTPNGIGGAGAAGSGGFGGDVESLPPIPELFFSEYVEGSSNNKALELSAQVDGSLEGCSVRVYLNGAETPSVSVPLAGTIVPSRPYVLCDTGISDPTPCDLLKALRFNGNDLVELRCREEILDTIGQAGEAPKERWGTPELGTLDQTLRRKCEIRSGDRDPSDAFDPALEWSAAEKDAFADLGSHCAEAE